MRIRFKPIVLTFLLLTGWCCAAHEIKGKIVNPENSPLEGIGVYNQRDGNYTYSNLKGQFTLSGISYGDRLVFYGLGYENRQLTVEARHITQEVEVVLEDAALSLDQIILYSETDPLSKLLAVDLLTNPISSSQEILRKVPGLFIGQHAGGGKAEQLFFRGFDIDHGTDISIDVEGLPVNMVSHAHGQGYADLHFIIPETIQNLNFGKGPYYENKGNFNTAGYVSLKLKDVLEENTATLEVGQFNTRRLYGAVQLLDREKHKAFVASELLGTDGVFEASQNFGRVNLLGRYYWERNSNEALRVSIAHFQSKWDASGQIPVRAVANGRINRFGAIDSTEGGNTSRTNLWLNHTKEFDEHNILETKAYLTAYDFELYSNFTFFLEDPENGDQIRQKEGRTIIGAETALRRSFHGNADEDHRELLLGGGFRYDMVRDVELSRTVGRDSLLEALALGDTDELNAFAYSGLTLRTGEWTFLPGLRLDYFSFRYQDRLLQDPAATPVHKWFLSPNFNVKYTLSEAAQFFFKSGFGYHSNDSRVVVAREGESVLPGAFGMDLGSVFRPYPSLVVNAALWGLWLQQEFVYVGDAGIVEPSGRTRRLGLDIGLRQQLGKNLFLYSDVNYAFARSTTAEEGSDYIPLAPKLTAVGGISLNETANFSGGIHFRYIADRPANEDFTLRAAGYTVTDININYHYKNWTLGLAVENLFDVKWNETQFATLSRLQNETAPVEEIHFTPGAPFFLKSKLSFTF